MSRSPEKLLSLLLAPLVVPALMVWYFWDMVRTLWANWGVVLIVIGFVVGVWLLVRLVFSPSLWSRDGLPHKKDDPS